MVKETTVSPPSLPLREIRGVIETLRWAYTTAANPSESKSGPKEFLRNKVSYEECYTENNFKLLLLKCGSTNYQVTSWTFAFLFDKILHF